MPDPRATRTALLVVSSTARRGAEVFASVLAGELEHHAVRADVLALADGGPGGLDVAVAGSSRRHPAAFARLVTAVRRHDVAVTNGGTTLLPTMIAAAIARRPFVYRNIGDPTVWGAARFADLRVGLPLRRAAAVAALYPAAADELAARYRIRRDRITVIPNAASTTAFTPVDDEERARLRAAFDLDDEHRWVAYVGALSEEKRPLAAIEAVLADDRLALVVAGDGPLADRCRDAAGDEVGRRVRFLGSIATVADLYRAADVVAIPSRTEGIPGAAIEAGLCGTPVVATDVGGLGHVVDASTGALVPANVSGADLAATLVDVADRRAVLGPAAAQRCREHFSMEVVARQWADVLHRAADPG